MKILKYGSIAVGLFLVVAVGFFCYSITKLPDPIAIKKNLNAEQEAQPETELQKEISNEVNDLAKSVDPENLDEKTNEIVEKKRGTNTETEIKELINEDFTDIRICDNLGKPMTKNFSLDSVGKVLAGEARDDATLESFRVPMKYIFQSKPVQELFAEIDNAAPGLEGEERTNYLKKIGFYTFAANKARQIYSMKSEYEEVSDRANHLRIIADIANKKPELALDKNILDFCNQLQGSLGAKSKTDIDEERKELLKLIEYSGLTPKELDFDPNSRTKFQLDLNTKGISFGFNHPGIKTQ